MAIIKPNNNTLSSITALPAAIPTGKVLQVVQSWDDQTSSSSSTYADVFASDLSITLSSTSNKVLIIANSADAKGSNTGGAANLEFYMRVVNTTTGSDVDPQSNASHMQAQSLSDYAGTLNVTVVDNATFSNTTQTYNVQIKRTDGNDAVYVRDLQVVIMEIAA
jgi:hypothetical protein